MKSFLVEPSKEFEADLDRYEQLLLANVRQIRARVIVDEIIDACEQLGSAPYRGTDWSAVRPGLRSVPLLQRGTLAFAIDEGRARVVLLGWFWRAARIAKVIQRYGDPSA